MVHITKNIFDDLKNDTLIVIPVDGSFEYRLRDETNFPEGINPNSLHGQLITKLGWSSFKDKVNVSLKKSNLRYTGSKGFDGNLHEDYFTGDSITIKDGNTFYLLLVETWLNKDGEAHLSDGKKYNEILTFESLIDRLIKKLDSCYKDREIRIPLIGTGIIRSNSKENLPKILYTRIKQAKFKKCKIWVKQEDYDNFNLSELS